MLIFSFIVAGTLLYYHWEAMLVSYLSTRKVTLPFLTLHELYHDTNLRLAVRPSTSWEDNFRYSSEELLRKIYEDRILPYRDEFEEFPYSHGMTYLIENDHDTALYFAYTSIRFEKDIFE